MTPRGFHDRKTASPTSLAVVIAIHAAALGALALMKGPDFVRPFFPDTEVTFIPLPTDPPEVPPPPRDERPRQPTRSQWDAPPSRVTTPTEGPVVSDPPIPPMPPIGNVGTEHLPTPRADPPPLPVRIEAEIDPRYARDLQPPYPPAEERAQRAGTVRLRVTIGADGRVKAIQKLSATSDAFWAVTERHALARWRFRPATVDGRPIESTKLMTLQFRIPD